MTDRTNHAGGASEPDEVARAAEAAADTAATGTAEEEPSVELLREELEQVRAQYQRAAADYQNLERRSREERLEVGRLAMADAVRSFLPILDDLERAIEAADAEGAGEGDQAPWLEGVRLVAQKFRNVLQQHGVEEIHALGQAFDPNKHEAVGAAPGPEGQVVHLLQRGYALRERVIRPALVMVGSGEGEAKPADAEAPTGAAEADAGDEAQDATSPGA